MDKPVVNVGILTEKEILFSFNGKYINAETGQFLSGEQRAVLINNQIVFNGDRYDDLFFEPAHKDNSFDIKAVTIGVQFHWQRKEDERFKGALNLVPTPEGITVINQVLIEEYLTSVISSEMSATASEELLKAHAVISRSWLLAQIEKSNNLSKTKEHYTTNHQTDTEIIKWYDREDHILFDVCADDHCQRYQGITRASSNKVKNAIATTEGLILTAEGKICDARFSKCCGGMTELFENCWEPVSHPYLQAFEDSQSEDVPDLTCEANADTWIRTSPKAFCNTTDKGILSQVLNNYDQETTDFYRWKVILKQEEISELIKRKSGIDFGSIKNLVPVERGTSGRLIKLRIEGTKKTMTIGKELEIRRYLSESHLYSSAFVIDKEGKTKGVPQAFILTGAGWGHGVGLCQIGAAMMGAIGYNYKQILSHYFRGTELEKRY